MKSHVSTTESLTTEMFYDCGNSEILKYSKPIHIDYFNVLSNVTGLVY